MFINVSIRFTFSKILSCVSSVSRIASSRASASCMFSDLCVQLVNGLSFLIRSS